MRDHINRVHPGCASHKTTPNMGMQHIGANMRNARWFRVDASARDDAIKGPFTTSSTQEQGALLVLEADPKIKNNIYSASLSVSEFHKFLHTRRFLYASEYPRTCAFSHASEFSYASGFPYKASDLPTMSHAIVNQEPENGIITARSTETNP